MPHDSFGDLFKARRIAIRKTLRVFCADGFDPGNISRLERGRLAPPASENKLREYAEALELQVNTAEWQQFLDFAAASRGEIPSDLLADQELVGKLPALFRTLRGEKVDPKKLDDFIDQIRRS